MKKALIWILGVVFTITVAVYQKMTGPTYPYKHKVVLNDKEYTLKLSRSGETTPDDISKPFIMILNIDEPGIVAMIQYRRYPTSEEFKTVPFVFRNGHYEAELPQQPAAGKLEYKAMVSDGKNIYKIPHQIIRFKDPVPAYWLVPHIFFMFLAMLFSNVAAFMAIFNTDDLSALKKGIKEYFKPTNFVGVSVWTAIFLAIGGLWLGPMVQKYAFGEFWTGIPFGWDLTDNKTLIAAVFWAIALYMNSRKPSRFWTITAAVVMLLVYAIPHSMFGSQLDPETGKVIQGIILFRGF
ncbi:MAG: hypothetical protein GXO47_12040 [Chlorobi bacterium]|nr:hypothetical protein [Chlorobiota bacterium]